MVTTDHLRPSHILLSCLHTPARLSNEHCVDIYFNINIAAVILSPDPLFTYGSPYTLHLGGIYVVYFYETGSSKLYLLLVRLLLDFGLFHLVCMCGSGAVVD